MKYNDWLDNAQLEARNRINFTKLSAREEALFIFAFSAGINAYLKDKRQMDDRLVEINE